MRLWKPEHARSSRSPCRWERSSREFWTCTPTCRPSSTPRNWPTRWRSPISRHCSCSTRRSIETGAPVDGAPEVRGFEDLGAYRAEIDQASGILTVQLGVGIEEAFIRLRAHAYAQGLRLADVAADVVAHRLRFSLDAEPDRTDEET